VVDSPKSHDRSDLSDAFLIRVLHSVAATSSTPINVEIYFQTSKTGASALPIFETQASQHKICLFNLIQLLQNVFTKNDESTSLFGAKKTFCC
jgi:hypothetical protein